MMRDADTTWALVVGIDDYASVNKLTGAAQDAVDVVGWLRRLGVPDTNILLHAAPAEPTQAAVAGLGLTVGGCREADLWESFRALSKKQGSKLFVFLMGHGLFEPGGSRVFLTQEADQEVLKNLSVEWYAAYLRGQAFTDQYVVMDGCLNLPYTAAERAKFTPGEQSAVVLPPPRPDVRQVYCFSAQQGEKALEIDGHGLFTQTLLKTLDPDHPDEGCVDLDDESGVVRLDLARAVNDIVAPLVTAKAPRQHPGLQALGAVRTSTVLPIVELVPDRTARVRVSVDPADAIEGVRKITLWSDSNDWRAIKPKPPDTSVPTTFDSVVPVGLEVVARLSVVQGGAWGQPEQQEFVAEADRDVVFKLAAQTPMPPAVDEVVLDAVLPDGQAAPATSAAAKAAITRALEEGGLSFAFDPAVAGTDLTVEMRPSGAMIRANGGLAGGVLAGDGGLGALQGITFDRMTTRVAKALDIALPGRVSVRVRPSKPAAGTKPPKRFEPEEATRLRIELSDKDAVRLGGFMLDADVVTIRHDTWSLSRLARSSGARARAWSGDGPRRAALGDVEHAGAVEGRAHHGGVTARAGRHPSSAGGPPALRGRRLGPRPGGAGARPPYRPDPDRPLGASAPGT